MELNNENKARFFALYWGQNCLCCEFRGEVFVDGLVAPEHKEDLRNYWLRLKPLSSLTDEEARFLGCCHKRDFHNYRSEYWENMELNPVCIDPDAQEEPQTEVATFGDYNAQTNPNYFHLEIKRQDMLNRWNQSSIKERATML